MRNQKAEKKYGGINRGKEESENKNSRRCGGDLSCCHKDDDEGNRGDGKMNERSPHKFQIKLSEDPL